MERAREWGRHAGSVGMLEYGQDSRGKNGPAFLVVLLVLDGTDFGGGEKCVAEVLVFIVARIQLGIEGLSLCSGKVEGLHLEDGSIGRCFQLDEVELVGEGTDVRHREDETFGEAGHHGGT